MEQLENMCNRDSPLQKLRVDIPAYALRKPQVWH